uniref:Uncharacterized protein n=1 Tax=Physcomitrium patens TaxID=3218 RepID=A0A2K1J1Q0_PHYPA|nr:hypothetical protein PHYPA_023351 [Physcomitrium patens]
MVKIHAAGLVGGFCCPFKRSHLLRITHSTPVERERLAPDPSFALPAAVGAAHGPCGLRCSEAFSPSHVLSE